MKHIWALITLLVALGTFSTDHTTPPDDVMAWVDPDGFLVIHVERAGELLYFDSFNVSALYDTTQSRSLHWQDRWEFRRE